MRDAVEFSADERVMVALSDSRTTVRERAVFVRRIKDGLTMNGEKQDTCLVIPEGCSDTVFVRYACLRKVSARQ